MSSLRARHDLSGAIAAGAGGREPTLPAVAVRRGAMVAIGTVAARHPRDVAVVAHDPRAARPPRAVAAMVEPGVEAATEAGHRGGDDLQVADRRREGKLASVATVRHQIIRTLTCTVMIRTTQNREAHLIAESENLWARASHRGKRKARQGKRKTHHRRRKITAHHHGKQETLRAAGADAADESRRRWLLRGTL